MLIDTLARTPGTLLHGELSDDNWTLDQHLLAIVADRVSMGNWQRQGKRGATRPKPISPLSKARDVQTFGNTKGRDPAEVAQILHGYRTGAFDRGG